MSKRLSPQNVEINGGWRVGNAVHCKTNMRLRIVDAIVMSKWNVSLTKHCAISSAASYSVDLDTHRALTLLVTKSQVTAGRSARAVSRAVSQRRRLRHRLKAAKQSRR